jgi:hypothetical protein
LFHCADAVTPVREGLDRMNREVEVAQGASVVRQTLAVGFVLERDPDDVSIEGGKPSGILRDDQDGGKKFDLLHILPRRLKFLPPHPGFTRLQLLDFRVSVPKLR